MKSKIKVPMIGESITEVTIGNWLIQNNDIVDEDQVICEVESEKATVEVTAEFKGKLTILVKTGETVAIGTDIAEIDTDAVEEVTALPVEKTDNKKTAAKDKTDVLDHDNHEIKTSPVAAKILKDAGLTAENVKGTGPGGKINKEDALKAASITKEAKQIEEKPAQLLTTDTKIEPDELPRVFNDRKSRREHMTTLRKTISRRLLEAKQGTAMLTTINEIDMSEIKKIRAKYKESFKEKYGISLGFMSFFTKACTLALQEFPVINSMIDGDDIIYNDFCDISIAIATDRGLVVPVIRNAEKKSLFEIEHHIAQLADKARTNKLTIEEMTGGTFSITNGGVFGSLISTPIINTPQSAILGMHTIQDRPVARDGQIVIRPMMYISLSYDHRIIDGRESVTFLVRLKEILEDPVRLLLQV